MNLPSPSIIHQPHTRTTSTSSSQPPQENSPYAYLSPVRDANLDPLLLHNALLTANQKAPRQNLLWNYYRNPITPTPPGKPSARPYTQAMEQGLPKRLTASPTPHEIVIENDIAWRISTMVDFLFGKPIEITSAALNPALRDTITAALNNIISSSGSIALFQELALLSHIFGSADLLLATNPLDPTDIRIKPIDPRRAVPILSPADNQTLLAYAITASRSATSTLIELFTPTHHQVLEIASSQSATGQIAKVLSLSPAPLGPGILPIVHMQNLTLPFSYEGLSDVEPLIPLQDELNTRLSDRAYRVTMQSFKMLLAKGIDNFEKLPIGPGFLISTENPNASITSFGGDSSCPSEDTHLEQLREALDKTSGVPPLATGVVQAKVGNLSSENALRLTLQGLIARTMRKRITCTKAINDLSALILHHLHTTGQLSTTHADRAISITWPDPIAATTRQAN